MRNLLILIFILAGCGDVLSSSSSTSSESSSNQQQSQTNVPGPISCQEETCTVDCETFQYVLSCEETGVEIESGDSEGAGNLPEECLTKAEEICELEA